MTAGPEPGPGIAGKALAPVEVDAHVVADLHRHARSGVEPVDPRLRPAPDAEAAGELAVDRPGEGDAAVDEAVAPVEADDAALQVGVEREIPRHRPLIEPAFDEQGEGVAAAAEAAQSLAPLGRDPDRNAGQRLDPDARRDFPPRRPTSEVERRLAAIWRVKL